MRKHAVLNASGSKRWLSCTPSARLEEQFPETKSDWIWVWLHWRVLTS